MGMSGDGQSKAKRAISNHQSFKNSTGSLSGTQGSTRQLGWLSSHPARGKLLRLLARASYVVWSYNTPIGFVVPEDPEDPGALYTQYVIEESHSTTTSHHQTLCRVGFDRYDDPVGETTARRNQERAEARNAARREARTRPSGSENPSLTGRGPVGPGPQSNVDHAYLSYADNEDLMLDVTGLFYKGAQR